MPVAAKFSEEFYGKFGHAATGELVEYLNTIDDTYRAELRSLNDSSWARFDAKLEQRASQLEALIDTAKALGCAPSSKSGFPSSRRGWQPSSATPIPE